MNLEEILAENGALADELGGLVGSEEDPTAANEEVSEILAELSQREDIDDEELDMIVEAAEQLGPDFPEWVEEYLNRKDGDMEYDESEDGSGYEEESFFSE